MAKIKIFYSCCPCDLVRVNLDVEERGPKEDVKDWLDRVAVDISFNHMLRSPDCVAQKISEIGVPITGVDRIGDVVKN